MSPETFRSRALECMRLAQDAGDSHHKSLLLGMAETKLAPYCRAYAWQSLMPAILATA